MLTPVVDTVNAAVMVPGLTVTLAGTPATPALLLESETAAPVCGAPLDKVIVPCDAEPPTTLDGLSVRFWRLAGSGSGAAGVTVTVAVRVVPLYAAVMVTVVLIAAGEVANAHVPVKPLAGARTFAGTLAAAGLLLDRAISAPPSGAGVLSTTVPNEPFPPTTVEGFVEKVDNVGGGGAASGVKLRVADHAPAVPVEFTPRTRQKRCVVDRPLVTY